MNIQDSKALVPVQTSIRLYVDDQYQGLDRFNRRRPAKDEMVFIGFGPERNENTYTPYGTIHENSKRLGELIDIYV